MEPHRQQTSAPGLNEGEKQEVEEGQRLPASVVYEIIRQEGEAELARPLSALWWSGVAAGMGISASVLTEGLLHQRLPDLPYRPLIENFGYCVGFLIVILGRMQLFTENTITAVLPVLSRYSHTSVWRMARLWGVVLVANLVGTLVAALLGNNAGVVHPETLQAMREISHHYAALSAGEALLYGIPAGFFVAAIVWILPSAEGSEFLVIVVLTYLIALGGFTHVIAGSAEVFLLQLSGELGVIEGFTGLILPTLIGNILGGTGLFTLLVYGQVQEEIDS